KPRPIEMEEALEYEFENPTPDSATMTLKWEKLAVPVKISVSPDTTVANIRGQMRGIAQYQWQAANQAAHFCLAHKINLDEALKWVNLSIQNEERFENLTTKADILKATNKPDDAKKAWDQALSKTTAQGLYSYARQLQTEKRDAEAMDIFKEVAKRYPDTAFAHLSNARMTSSACDFAGAPEYAQIAQSVPCAYQQQHAIT